ncbi:tetratricopeptide repeat protein [Sphingobacterium sp.]|uniref:tetratricopeptide repeat protein n=1 Tax=Sphingobacterium sp. TaxID=341027 RepID=UPI0028AA2BC2|nr:tetratricopeptide repeat protein [Sphingobacterium sp.]
MIDKVRIILAFGLITSTVSLKAQTNNKPLDPSGFVTKYDSSFAGIGPKVYVLPPPRTKEEELVDSYKEKQGFFDSISRQLEYQSIIEDYKPTLNASYLKQSFNPFPATGQEWNDLIAKLENNRNLPLAAGMANEYAYDLLKKGDINKAIALLIRGLNAARTSGSGEKFVLEHNLANAYLFNGNFTDAAAMQETFLRSAVEKKELVDQANTLVRIALVQAHEKKYFAAENTIIRRAFPLYNRTKNHFGKVYALINLAKIYQLQNKHTEAQWFLIQAKDLANLRKIDNELPEIEYMLAFSKYIQQNYKVAQLEFEKAKTLADVENNKVLQLAIADKLGDIYLMMGNFKDAEQELSSYWRLRNELF